MSWLFDSIRGLLILAVLLAAFFILDSEFEVPWVWVGVVIVVSLLTFHAYRSLKGTVKWLSIVTLVLAIPQAILSGSLFSGQVRDLAMVYAILVGYALCVSWLSTVCKKLKSLE